MSKISYILRRDDGPTPFDEKLFRMLDLVGFRCKIINNWEHFLNRVKEIDQGDEPFLLVDPTSSGFSEQSFRKELLSAEGFKNTKIVLIQDQSHDTNFNMEELLDVDGVVFKDYETYEIAFVINRLVFPHHSNRRRHPRALAKVTGICSKVGSPQLECVSVDLSVAGAFLKTDEPHPIGSEINLQIKLPNLPRPIQCKGTVVHTRNHKTEDLYPSGMGIRFDDIFASDRSKLFDFISPKFLRIERRATDRSLT